MRGVACLGPTALQLAGASEAEAAKRRVPPGWLGVTVDGSVEARDAKAWDRMPRAGVETVRAAFVWSHVQPNPPGGSGASFNFGSTDALAIAAAHRGLALLPVVQRTPSGPPCNRACSPLRRQTCPPWGASLARSSSAYGPRGSLWRERPDVPRGP